MKPEINKGTFTRFLLPSASATILLSIALLRNIRSRRGCQPHRARWAKQCLGRFEKGTTYGPSGIMATAGSPLAATLSSTAECTDSTAPDASEGPLCRTQAGAVELKRTDCHRF